MAMLMLIPFIPMAAEAIERVLNKLLSNSQTCENQRLTGENKQLREQLNHNLNEQKQKNDALAARNQQLFENNADKEREVISDPRTAQIQQFLEPMETSEEELEKRTDASSDQNQQFFEQKDKQKKKAEENNGAHVIQNQTTLTQSQSNEKDVQAISDELAAENIELEKQLEHYQKQQEDELKEMENLLAQLKAKKLNSFEDIENQDKQAKETLIKLAKKAKPFGMEGNNIAFFGSTATGKSTILNKLYGDKVAETGIGETTFKVTSYKTKDFILWDIPGKNDEVSYMSMQYISFFKGLTRRLILITHTFKENSGMMKFLDAIGLDYDVVVNKMDQYDEEERSEFCEKIKKEKETIGLKDVDHIFFVSAKFPQQFPGWLDMVNYLSIPPK